MDVYCDLTQYFEGDDDDEQRDKGNSITSTHFGGDKADSTSSYYLEDDEYDEQNETQNSMYRQTSTSFGGDQADFTEEEGTTSTQTQNAPNSPNRQGLFDGNSYIATDQNTSSSVRSGISLTADNDDTAGSNVDSNNGSQSSGIRRSKRLERKKKIVLK